MLAVVIFVNGVELHGHFPLAFSPKTAYWYLRMLSLLMGLHTYIMLPLLRTFITIQSVKVIFCLKS